MGPRLSVGPAANPDGLDRCFGGGESSSRASAQAISALNEWKTGVLERTCTTSGVPHSSRTRKQPQSPKCSRQALS